MYQRSNLIDCICDGRRPWCAVCVVSAAFGLRRAHPTSLSVGMLRRRIPDITGRESALLIEATKRAA